MLDTVSFADDPDLAHLIDLLDVLPHPQDDSFWDVNGSGIGSKIGYRVKAILKGRGHRTDVDYLAVYVLEYLGHGNRYITEADITRNLRGAHSIPAAGHAWVDDATRTAWTLVLRYSLSNWRGTRSTPGQRWLED